MHLVYILSLPFFRYVCLLYLIQNFMLLFIPFKPRQSELEQCHRQQSAGFELAGVHTRLLSYRYPLCLHVDLLPSSSVFVRLLRVLLCPRSDFVFVYVFAAVLPPLSLSLSLSLFIGRFMIDYVAKPWWGDDVAERRSWKITFYRFRNIFQRKYF